MIKTINKYMKGLRARYLLGMSTSIVSQAAVVLAPIIIKITVDNILSNQAYQNSYQEGFVNLLGGREFLRGNLWLLGLAIFIVYLVRGLATFLRMYICPTTAEEVTKKIKDRMYDTIQRLPYAEQKRLETGDLIQRCTSDIDTVRRLLAQQLPDVFTSGFLLIISVAMMVSLNLKLALLSIGILPISFVIAVIFFKRIKDKFDVYEEAESKLTVNLQETLSGVRIVKAFGMESYEKEKFDERNEGFRLIDFDLLMNFANYWTIADFLSYLQIAFVVIAGTVFAYRGDITVGTMIAFISYVNSLVWPVRNMGRILTEMSKTSVSVGRIEEIINSPIENLYENGKEYEIKGDIEFQNVDFKYDDGTDHVFKDVSFKVNKGQTLALIGPTGSGKSSMVALLARLHEYNSGSIKIDGVELKDIDKGLIRENVGIVLQEPYLFNKTVGENIKLARPNVADEKMYEASKISSIHRDITGFDKQYDTVVGEKGISLSGGQKQRIAIARTIIRETPIMIFDDSLSAVDTETDIMIREALKSSNKESTRIIITHRISTAMDADIILVLDGGRIIERGTHSELLKMGGMYKRIYDIQNMLETA
ncbi:MAG: ABC transporter ATP-binding protein [Tissierellia bacterium]|nr:ABC transporter ATP-binding protein [Tissierellia bacterium]